MKRKKQDLQVTEVSLLLDENGRIVSEENNPMYRLTCKKKGPEFVTDVKLQNLNGQNILTISAALADAYYYHVRRYSLPINENVTNDFKNNIKSSRNDEVNIYLCQLCS